MKKINLLIIALLVSFSFFAQRRSSNVKWLSLELKGGYGSTVLFNSDVSSEPNVSQNFISGAYNYGARFGVTFGDYVGVFVERLSEHYKQLYDVVPGEPLMPYTKTQSFSSADLVFAIRYTNDYGFYVEAGPVFSSLKTAEETNGDDYSILNPGNDYIDNFSKNNTALMFGLGFSLFRSERVAVNLGLRTTYAFGDFVENKNFYVLNDLPIYNGSSTGASTNPFSIKLMLGVHYFFGFWGNASCGKGRLMFFQ